MATYVQCLSLLPDPKEDPYFHVRFAMTSRTQYKIIVQGVAWKISALSRALKLNLFRSGVSHGHDDK